MKLLRLSAIAAITLASATASAQPQAHWLDTTHNFGAFDEATGSVVTYFKVVNVGNKPLSLLSVRASCGCTTPTYSRKPIAPGDTGQVAVTYNPAGRPGRFNKKIRVETNAEPPATTLTIAGVVIADSHTLSLRYPVEVGPLKLKNSVVQLGEMAKGRTKTAFLDGYNQSNDTIRPTLVGLPPGVIADVTPEAVPPGEQTTLTIYYDSSKAADQWGLVMSEMTVVADQRPEAPTQAITLAAIVNEDFSGLTAKEREQAPKAAYSTAMVDLGRVARGKVVEASLLIDNFGQSPLILRRLYCPDGYVTFTCDKEKVAPGSRASVAITVDTSTLPADTAMVNTRLTIITNDPRRPSTPIRIVAELID